MYKKTKLFLTIALVLLMSFASIVPALANNGGPMVSNPNGPDIQATITKHLRLPIGTTTPDTTFNFIANRISVDGREFNASTPAMMPELSATALTVDFSALDTDNTTPTPDTLNIRKETGDLFENITFPHAGIFVYIIEEQADTNPNIDNNPNELLYYSDARYRLEVHVANHTDGGLYISGVGAKRLVAGSDDQGQKVDPSPGQTEFDFSEMSFTNDYIKTDIPPGVDPDPRNNATLYIRNDVTGGLGDRSMFFDFAMTLAIPELIRDDDSRTYYKAYIFNGDSLVTDITNNLADDTETGTDAIGPYIKVSTEEATSFRLRDGQRLVFADTPVGTRYTVTETAVPNYITSFVVTTGGNPAPSVTGFATGLQLVEEGLNRTVFTNNRESIPITGLLLNNLPFIGLIVLALGSLSIFIVLKARKRKHN